MKYKKIGMIIFLVLGMMFISKKQVETNQQIVRHQKQIDAQNLENVDYLMIVAHPDDETIWGGSHLLDGRYLVVCLTNGDNKKRSEEFKHVMEMSGNQGLMFDYPDKIKGKRDDWQRVMKEIENDITYLLHKKKWNMVITHNPNGEYGHIHHKMTSKIVTKKMSDELDQLMYFGIYYKKEKMPMNLPSMDQDSLKKKMELIALYPSQKKVMDHLSHMISHENWIKAKDW